MGNVGSCKVGTLKVGAESCTSAWEADSVPLAKDYTVFLAKADAAASELVTDLGQEETDLNGSGTGYAYATAGNGNRFAIGSERSLMFRLVGVTNSDAGYLCRYDEGTSTTDAYALEIYDDGGTKKIRAYINDEATPDGSSRMTVPGLSAAGSQLAVKWCSRPNPLTTGASDAILSKITIRNITTGAQQTVEWTHAAFNVGTGKTFTIGAAKTDGTSSFGKHIIGTFRMDDRWVTDVEMREDLDTQTVAPSTSARVESQHLQLDTGTGVDARDEWHGPEYQLAARHAHDIVRRFEGVYPNERFRQTPTFGSSSHAGNPDIIQPPGADDPLATWYMYLPWGFLVPVSDAVDRFHVRCHLKTWVTSGGAQTVGIRAYSMNRRPANLQQILLEPPEELVPYYVEATVTRDDGAGGTGQHLDLGELKISRGDGGSMEGKTFVCLAYQIFGADVESAQFQIADFSCVHYRRDPSANEGFFGGVEDLQP